MNFFFVIFLLFKDLKTEVKKKITFRTTIPFLSSSSIISTNIHVPSSRSRGLFLIFNISIVFRILCSSLSNNRTSLDERILHIKGVLSVCPPKATVIIMVSATRRNHYYYYIFGGQIFEIPFIHVFV